MKTVPRKQDGAVMILVLIFLVIFLIGNAAVMSSTQSTNAILISAAFRSSSIAVSDTVLATAKAYLLARGSDLDATKIDTTVAGSYYRLIQANSDAEIVSAFPWANQVLMPVTISNRADSTDDLSGYRTQYVIERLCQLHPGDAATFAIVDVAAYCQLEQAPTSPSAKVGAPIFSNTAQVLYRITTRVLSPRDSEATAGVYTQTLVSM
jgi:hypothetical protein